MKINSQVPRGTIKFWQIFGTVVTALIIVATIWMYTQGIVPKGSDDPTFAIIIGVEIYFLWKSIYSAFVIINYMDKDKTSDEEIIANRFILAVLSLGVGGFCTPFVLTSLPKNESNSSISPRAFLSKHLGWTMLIGSLLTFVTITIVSSISTKNFVFSNLFTNQFLLITNLILVVMLLIGLLGVISFTKNNLQADQEMNFAQKFVGIIFTIIATVEVVIIAIESIIRLIAVIADSIRLMMESDGFFRFLAVFIAFARISFQMMYVGMVMRICGSIISGIWAKDQTIKIRSFKNIDEKEAIDRQKFSSQ